MKRLLLSFATAVVVALAVQSFTIGALAPRLPWQVLRPAVREARHHSLPAVQLVHVLNADGAINVATYDGDSVEVSADIRAYPETYAGRSAAERYVGNLVKIDKFGDTIAIITEPEDRPDSLDLRVDYELLLPVGTDISLVCMSGNVWVGAGCGRVLVKGNYTDITITEPEKNVVAKTVTGRIEVVNARHPTSLETVNGSIYAQMMGGRLKASTTTGDIYATVLEPAVDECDLTVMNGDITLVMSERCSARVEATTGRGTVASEFAFADAAPVQRKRRIEGSFGAGRTKATLESLNGDIKIARSET